MERRLDYDIGPQSATDEGASAENEEGESRTSGSLKRGLAIGTVAFFVVYAVTYQLSSAMMAVGYVEGTEPSRWILAGLAMLGSHGAPLEAGGEPVPAEWLFGFLTPVLAVVPIVVLTAAGFVLARRVATGSRGVLIRRTGTAGAAAVFAYVTLTTALARLARWTRGEANGGGLIGGPVNDGPITVVAPIDSSFLLTVSGTTAVFLGLGVLLALFVSDTKSLTTTAAASRTETESDADSPAGDDSEQPSSPIDTDDVGSDENPQREEWPAEGDGDRRGNRPNDPSTTRDQESSSADRTSRDPGRTGATDADPTSRYGRDSPDETRQDRNESDDR